MEFIDPKLKQKHNKRLTIGYVLFTILVGLATYILIITAQGYQVFQRNGQVIRNGLLFIDSKPVSADVYVNGEKESNKTDLRLTLPESEYEIILKAEGYKDWTKRILLEGGQVVILDYPRLFPSNLSSSQLKSYVGDGNGFLSQSPDKRWILYQADSKSNEINIIDTTKTNDPQRTINIPFEALGLTKNPIGRVELIEWADDNRHFLIKHTLPDGKSNFSIIDKDDLSKSLNINKLFNIEPSRVSLIGGKTDKVYLYLATGGLLRVGDVKNKSLGNQIFDQVLDYKPIGGDRIMFVTTKNSTNGNVTVNVSIDNKIYLIGETYFDPDGKYHLNAVEYLGDWYYVIGSDKASVVVVYKNPQNFTETSKDKTPNKLLTLKSTPPLQLSLSPKNRFILLNGTKNFAIYDIETQKTYNVNLSSSLATVTNLSWLDNFLIQYSVDDKLYISEFDGKNTREITGNKGAYRSFVDSQFKRLYNLKSENGVVVSQVTEMTIEK